MTSLGDEVIPKALVLAVAKAGKTTTIAKTATAALGAGYIACCSTVEHLRGTKEQCEKAGLTPPEFDMVKNPVEDMEACLKTARQGVKEGKYKWVLVDDMGLFCSAALEAFAAQHQGNGRKYWDAYTRYVSNTILRWLDLRCPVFASMHYMEMGAEMDGQVAKSGPGIVPAVQGGTLRQFIPGAFNQVIWLEKRGDERVFRLSVEGVTGPGCNNLPDDVKEVKADVGQLLAALAGKPVEPVGKTATKGVKR